MPSTESSAKKFELSTPVAIVLGGALIAVAIIATHYLPGSAPASTAAAANEASAKVSPPSQDEHIVGRADAPIVLIEYSDFQCSYCASIYPTLKKIVSESGGEVAWVMRSLPLVSIHPEAEPAALAGECIAAELGNEAFWKYADAVFANQVQLSATFYTSIAAGLGADPAAFQSCISSKKHQDILDRESFEGQSLGAQGTPYVVVLNTKTGSTATIPGALPYAQAKAVIQSVK